MTHFAFGERKSVQLIPSSQVADTLTVSVRCEGALTLLVIVIRQPLLSTFSEPFNNLRVVAQPCGRAHRVDVWMREDILNDRQESPKAALQAHQRAEVDSTDIA